MYGITSSNVKNIQSEMNSVLKDSESKISSIGMHYTGLQVGYSPAILQ